MGTSRPRLGALLCVALLGCAPLSACGEQDGQGLTTADAATSDASVGPATTSPSGSAEPAAAPAAGNSGDGSGVASGASPDPATPSEPADPVVPATTSPPPVPREPTAARSQTSEGARAFLGYYVAVLDRAFQFGDATPLGAYEGPDCTLCRTHATEIDALGAQQRRAGGTAYTAELGTPRATGAGRLEVPLTLTRAAAPVVDASGTRVGTLRPSSAAHVVVLDWTGLGWQVTDLRRSR